VFSRALGTLARAGRFRQDRCRPADLASLHDYDRRRRYRDRTTDPHRRLAHGRNLQYPVGSIPGLSPSVLPQVSLTEADKDVYGAGKANIGL
jgi:hypothetical protein